MKNSKKAVYPENGYMAFYTGADFTEEPKERKKLLKKSKIQNLHCNPQKVVVQ